MTELVLRWSGGELDLMGWNESAHGDFLIETLADGTDWGNPEPVRRKLRRFLLDGSSSVKDYDDNRTIPLSLRVKAADGNALAGGEAALDQVDGRRCELVWTPPDVFSAAAVFVVDFADLRHKMDDLSELRLERFYSLTLECQPHARSDEWVEVPAIAASVSTRTEFDDGTSTTGWVADGATLSVSDSSVLATANAGYLGWVVTRIGAVDFTTDRYLTLTGYGLTELVIVEVQVGATWTAIPQVTADAGAFVFDTGAVAASAVRFTFNRVSALWGGLNHLSSLGKQSTPRSVASKEQLRSFTVPGSRRTPVFVEVESTDPLGDVVLYSGPNYDPTMVSGVTPGANRRVANAGAISGGMDFLAIIGGSDYTVARYRRRASELPVGGYVIWMRAESMHTGNYLELTARLLDESGTLISSFPLGTVVVPTPVGGGMPIFPVTAAELPGWSLPEGSVAIFELQVAMIGSSSPPGGVNVDQIWLFNITDGKTPTIIKSGGSTRLWIDPPTLARDVTAIYMGSGDRSAAYPVSLLSEAISGGGVAPSAAPPQAYLYTGFSTSDDGQVVARFRPAHHTHPTA